MDIQKLIRTVQTLTTLLAAGSYEQLESLSGSMRLSADDLRSAVDSYGRKVVPLPEDGIEHIDCVEVTGSQPKAWSVNVPIYTQEEGRSDLTLSIRLIQSSEDIYRVEIEDLHVL